MERIQMPEQLQRNIISVSDERCKNIDPVNKTECKRKLVIKDGALYCFYCSVIAKEDLKVKDECDILIKNKEVNILLDAFKEKSLMNRDLEEATFESYFPQNDSQKQALINSIKYVDSFDNRKGILYFGSPGLGKSHLAASIVKEIIRKKHTGIFISLPRLMTELKATYSKKSELSEIELLSALQKVDLLVMDDLGVERDGKDDASTWAKQKIYEIVDSRIGQATIYTTNYTGKELLQMYGERDFSRMVQDCSVIKLEGKNYRLKDFK